MSFQTQTRSRRTALAASCAALALAAGLAAAPANALTDAGQPIQNQATATYKDALGNDYTSQSNLATVEVKQVYFATLGSDGAKTVASNQTVYFQHILTNTGNGDDTYRVNLAQESGDTGDFDTLAVYIDLNDNGTVDSGEPLVFDTAAGSNAGTQDLTLISGEQVSLVVAGLVPTATDGNTFGALLTVEAFEGTSGPVTASVTDLTSTAGGADSTQGTNQDVATVSGDAVLNVTKSSVHDEANKQIAYTVTITNTGNSDAKDVTIFDALPAGTTFVSVSQSGFGPGIDVDDEAAQSVAQLSETALTRDLDVDGDIDKNVEADFGLDLDRDGENDTSPVPGVFGFDSVLEPGVSVNLTFTVSYDPATFGAGADVVNQAFVGADLDDDPSTDESLTPSNLVTDTVPQLFNVTVTDSNTGAANGVNDGGDDDAAPGAGNDQQTVDSVQAGELVYFTHIITNTGNGTDTFELDINDVSGFPPGTAFTIWNETSTVQLLNTNGAGGVDTGPLAAGESLTVVVHAQLPSSGTATNASYDLRATSSADPSSTPASDGSDGLLQEIVAPTVDLSNGTTPDDAFGTDADAYSNATPITTKEANPGDSITFDLVIQNDSLVADSFQLSSGGSWNGSILGGLPPGWSVVFRDLGGNVVTTTPSIASRGFIQLTAEVQIPSVETQAVADYSFDLDGDSSDETVQGNGDGDGDYGIFFRAVSVNSGASDIKLDAVDVLPREEITLLQNNSGQVQPGGSIDYPHTLQNDGNTVEEITLSAANDTPGWSNNLLVDTPVPGGACDGAADTPFASLSAGASICFVDASGTLVVGALDGDGELVIEPGESLNFIVRTFAPNSAPNGQLDILTVTAGYNSGGATVTNIDRSEVVTAQLRMVKTASVNADCSDGGATAIADQPTLGPDAGFTETAASAAPGECIVWQVVATNAGVDKITDVEITDAVPAFSTYEAGTLRLCRTDAGPGATSSACDSAWITLTDSPSDPDEGQQTANDVRFQLKDDGGTASVNEAEIASGASVTVRFSTKVD
ncbi:MAG: DUF11 domain-containing protein [Pseudomonadota bacterium]